MDRLQDQEDRRTAQEKRIEDAFQLMKVLVESARG